MADVAGPVAHAPEVVSPAHPQQHRADPLVVHRAADAAEAVAPRQVRLVAAADAVSAVASQSEQSVKNLSSKTLQALAA